MLHRLAAGVSIALLALGLATAPADGSQPVADASIHGDNTVFRPSNGDWYSYFVGIGRVHFGTRGDVPVPRFYTGRDRPNLAVFRPSSGNWYIRGLGMIHWGTRGDIPVPADYSVPLSGGSGGHSRADIAVFRPSTGNWYIRGIGTVHYGARGDRPVPADYNGDGYTDIAVFRPSTGVWYVRGVGAFRYGTRGDIPVPGNYVTGDSRARAAVFRPSSGTWYIRGVGRFHYGTRGDVPIPADQSGRSRTDIAVFRPSTGMWYTRGGERLHYGTRGDVPVPGAYTGAPIYYPHTIGRVSRLAAKPGWTSVKLSWQTADSYTTGVVIRRAKGRVAPFSPTDGTPVTSTSAGAYSDTGLRSNTTYSYSVFAMYKRRFAGLREKITVTTGGPATISGTVTDVGGTGLAGVEVTAYAGKSNLQAGQARTDARGHYAVGGLRAAAYKVCFDAAGISGGASATGYVSECYRGVPWHPSGPGAPSKGATSVTVKDASTVKVNVALTAGSAISGTITAASDGTGLSHVSVSATDATGESVVSMTGADGSYRIDGLAAGAYTVCFNTTGASGGPSTTGYVSECYDNVAWIRPRGGAPPSGATPVTVSSDKTTTLDAAVADAGTLSGVVTATSGAKLAGVGVMLFDSQGRRLTVAFTDSVGAYSIHDVPPDSYTVCFYAVGATGGSATTGYASECHDNRPWNPGGRVPPSKVTPVVVRADSTSSVNAQLDAAGLLSGTVRAQSGTGLGDAYVAVYGADGALFTGVYALPNGSYTVDDLPAGSYTVCFGASGPASSSSPSGYAGQCEGGVPWSGALHAPLPAGTKSVTVTAGTTTTVNVSLIPGGTVSGTVSAAGGAKLQDVRVDVFANGGALVGLAYAMTDSKGSYTIANLIPGTYTVCFDASLGWEAGTSARTTFVSGCYEHVAWDGTTSAPPPGTTPVTVAAAGSTATADVTLGAKR